MTRKLHVLERFTGMTKALFAEDPKFTSGSFHFKGLQSGASFNYRTWRVAASHGSSGLGGHNVLLTH